MNRQNGMSGYVAGITVAAVLQPLENIKVALMFPTKTLNLTNNFISNFIKVTTYLSQNGGFKSFYKGLTVNLIKTGFSSAIFFTSLRALEQTIENKSVISSFIVSAGARILSAIASNPFQVIQTRFQLPGNERWKGGLAGNIMKVYRHEGIYGYFKGCLASCYKEGFFAGLYYTFYNALKAHQMPAAFAGILSGIVSTAITHPFQLIKSKIQVDLVVSKSQSARKSIFLQLSQLIKNGHAFRGLTPRLVKKPLSNTIAFLIFQSMEQKNAN